MHKGFFFGGGAGIKRLRRVHRSPPSGAEITSEWNYASALSYMLYWCWQEIFFFYRTSHDAQTELYKLKMCEVKIKKSNPYLTESTPLFHYTEQPVNWIYAGIVETLSSRLRPVKQSRISEIIFNVIKVQNNLKTQETPSLFLMKCKLFGTIKCTTLLAHKTVNFSCWKTELEQAQSIVCYSRSIGEDD